MKIIPLFLFIVFLVSCKKESDIVSFPRDLHESRLIKARSVKLYSNKKQILDQNVIKNFINQSEYFQYEPVNPNEKITFLSQDSALLCTSCGKFAVSKSGNQFLFTSSTYTNIFNHAIKGLLKYESLITAFPGGYSIIDKHVGYGDYSNIDMSFFAYKIVERTGGYSISSGVVKNEFNPDYINTLGPIDTIAIQEFTINYSVKR